MTKRDHEEDESWIATFIEGIGWRLWSLLLFCLIGALGFKLIEVLDPLLTSALADTPIRQASDLRMVARLTFAITPLMLTWVGFSFVWRVLTGKVNRYLNRLLLSRGLCGISPVAIALFGHYCWPHGPIAIGLLVSTPLALLCALDAILLLRRVKHGCYGDCVLELAEIVSDLRKGDVPPDDGQRIGVFVPSQVVRR